MNQLVYPFDNAPQTSTKEILGGKGAGLAVMTSLGIPVPPGFVLSTGVCTHFYDNDGKYPDALRDQVASALAQVEATVEAQLGDPACPLLVSVRSGARVSMPA